MTAGSIIRAMRPKQWTKNLIVPAALVFALGDKSQQIGKAALLEALLATLGFCLVSSAIYLINDVKDAPLDRQHPVKKRRPVAAGEISPAFAVGLAFGLLGAGFLIAYRIGLPLVQVMAGYIALQTVYIFALKQVALLDLFVIALGFVLRALAGAVAVQVAISPWLLLCTLLLAMFLALCKRRHEKVVLEDFAGETRPSLRDYDQKLLDQLIAVISAATLVCYALYTLAPDTVAKFGSARLGFTIPFVMFGIFRYLDLVYRHEHGGRPEQTLLTDWPLLVNVALYGATVLALLLF